MGNNQRPLVAFLLLIICLFPVYSEAPFRVTLNPGAILPLGENSSFFSPGALATVNGVFILPPLSWLSIGGNIGYSYNQYGTDDSLSMITAGGGAGIIISPADKFYIQGNAAGGFSMSLLSIAG